jgi:hypothetical protein
MRRFLLAVFALLIAGLLGAGWYVYHKGFTKRWRLYVTEEFQKRGVELTLQKLTFNPVRGLIAKNVKVFDTRDRKRTLAVVDEMRLVINWANAIDGRTFLDALDLKDATLSLPVDPGEPRGPKIEIRRMSGRLYLPPKQVVLSSLEAEVYGVRVTASGRIVNPQEARRKKPPGDPKERSAASIVAQVVDELNALRFDSESPNLELRFSGDLAVPETVFVEARLWAPRVRRGDWVLDSLFMDALYRNERLTLRQLSVNDARGALRISGTYDPRARGLELQVRSTLDPQPAVKAFGRVPKLEEFVFYDTPALDLNVRAAFGDSPDIYATGRLDARRFAFRSVVFDRLGVDLVWNGERWAARNVKLAHKSGEVTGDIMQTPGDFRVRLTSSINPEVVIPFLPPKASEWLGQFHFMDAPSIAVEARGPTPDAKTLWANGVLRIGRASYRDIWAQAATATLRYADRQLNLDPMRVVRTEGTGEGGLTFDFARDEVEIRKFRSSLHPQEIVWWIDRNLVKDIAPYRFGKKPPQLFFDGLVHTRGGNTTRLRVDVEAPGGMDYTFMRRDLHLPRLDARLLFAEDRLKIEQLNGTLFGGKIRGTLDISLKKEKPGHQAELWLDDVDFASLTKLYFNYDDSKGRLDARYAFTGRGDDTRSMRGRGQLSVSEGKVFAIPFLGPLSGILSSIVPGMGDDVARKGSASFALEKGVIDTTDFLVEGRGFSMIGGGKLYFLDDKMDFDARINAKGLPGVLLFPVSKLFEYTATDSLSKPNWRPKIVPRL